MSAIDCHHCGLPVPSGLIEEGANEQFCCAGCRTIHEIIQASGFGAYYRMRDRRSGAAVELEDRRFEELDDPAFATTHCVERPDGARQTELHIEGVHCSACMWLIERALASEEGVIEARLEFTRRRLRLVWDPARKPLSTLARRLTSFGYTPHPARNALNEGERASERALLIRLAVAGAVAGNVMLMAFALYGGWFSGMDEGHRQFFRWLSLIVTVPTIAYSAQPFFRGAWAGLRAGVLHMDLPISIGIVVGFLGGAFNTFRGAGEIYFDSVAALVFLLLVGRLLQRRQQLRASQSSELLYALTPSSAIVEEGDEPRRVPVEALTPGRVMRVGIGERIPVDGQVLEGASAVDQALLSGESVPVSVKEKDEVFGGTTNLEAPLRIRVLRTVSMSRIGRIADLVVEARESRAPVVQLADRVAGVFVAVVLFLAAATLIGWWRTSPLAAIDHAVALLIVSCPCALGLATPLAMTAAIGRAARQGMLVRTATGLETLGGMRAGTIFFDKTGTLTTGRMEVVRWRGPDWVKPLVAALEAGVGHPVGRALGAFAGSGLEEAEAVEQIAGGGLTGSVGGRRVRIGSPAFVAAEASTASNLTDLTERWTADALTPVWVAVDGDVVAVAGIADRVRSDARASVDALRARGFEVAILSGDHPEVVAAVGEALGLSPQACLGAMSPEDKLCKVQQTEGPVIMLGDGVNDAAALSAATVGVAVHGGAETCLEAADVLLRTEGVSGFVGLVDEARRTHGRIRANIVFSLLYNTFGASLAISGALNPLVAAVLMPLSSLVVVTNSFRAPLRLGRPVRPGAAAPPVLEA